MWFFMSCQHMWHPEKKIKKFTTHHTQISLYLIITPVYSNITLTLLAPQKFFPYVTQIDQSVVFQTSHVCTWEQLRPEWTFTVHHVRLDVNKDIWMQHIFLTVSVPNNEVHCMTRRLSGKWSYCLSHDFILNSCHRCVYSTSKNLSLSTDLSVFQGMCLHRMAQ
jgi:hypothetical protein